MTSFALDENGDILVENNNFKLITGADEYKQILLQRLRSFYGEWFLDETHGLPYFQTILQKGVSPSNIEALFIQEILDSPGIVELLSFTTDLDSERKLVISFSAKTESGIISVNNEVLQ